MSNLASFDIYSSILLETDVYIHFDVEKLAYRVGQMLDDLDHQIMSGLIFIHKAEYTLAPSSGDNHDIKINSSASQNDFASLKQKTQKIPKPRNQWIIYRQEKHSIVSAENPGMHTSTICRYIVPFTLQHIV